MIAVVPIPAFLIAMTLPPTETDRRLKAQADAARPEAEPVGAANG